MTHDELKRVLNLLQHELRAARIEAITDGQLQWLFQLRPLEMSGLEEKKKRFLLLDARPSSLRFHTIEKRFAADSPHGFTMLLRKMLIGKRLRSFQLSENDRVIQISIGNLEEEFFCLNLELTGRKTNLFLCDSSHQVLSSFFPDSTRPILTKYSFPKSAIALLTGDRFAETADSELLAAWALDFSKLLEEESLKGEAAALLLQISQAIKKSNRLQSKLQNELKTAEEIVGRKFEADLLAANFKALKKGMETIQLTSFDGEDLIEIKLQANLSPRENIDERYHQIRRMQRAIPLLETRILDLYESITCLENARMELDELEEKENLSQITALRERLTKEFPKSFSSSKNTPLKAENKKGERLPYREFRSLNDIAIWVGRSASDNDKMTFRYGRANDTWLHVTGSAGSHVIIKAQNPDLETLLDAATLAMHYSKQSKANMAEVHIVARKYVRRIKGAPPGKVSISEAKQMMINQDEERIRRLMQS